MECFCVKACIIRCKIFLLDEQELIHDIEENVLGQQILDFVFHHLNLIETAYFGLRYLDQEGQTHWLDPVKKINRQLKDNDNYHILYFSVKFYAVDPCKLLEEITRYQFFLQVKQDVLQGRLPVSFELAAVLGAYTLQSELGDYDSRRHSPGYVSEFRFLTNQTIELEMRIGELHKTLIGQLPSVAELNYLDKVKWLEMYGVDLHPVLGEDNVEYFLGLTPSGIVVLRNKNTVGNYYWPRISKIYFKGRYFMLRVTDKNNDENTYGFETPSKGACKHLWKCCVEHHAFFRLVQISPTASDIFALSSRFRYSGRTEKQAIKDVETKIRTPPSFSRTPSRRYQRRGDEGFLNNHATEDQRDENYYQSNEIKHISIPQPAHGLIDSAYRLTCKTTSLMFDTRTAGNNGEVGDLDSPRSTRSVPWNQPHSRGLYHSSNTNATANLNSTSPRSVRSLRSLRNTSGGVILPQQLLTVNAQQADDARNFSAGSQHRCRSSSIDSHSSNDSRSYQRRRQHRYSRVTSDNESELSKSSSRSHRKHRRHRSRGNRRGDSGSEQDNHSQRRKSSGRTKRSEGDYELVDSGSQWREVQKKKLQNAEASVVSTSVVQHTNLIRKSVNSKTVNNNNIKNDINTETDTYNLKDKVHHNRKAGDVIDNNFPRRLREPTLPLITAVAARPETSAWFPLSDELKKHLDFDLIETEGMTDAQRREIPYTVIQTANHIKQTKVRNMKRAKTDVTTNVNEKLSESPPPPYSPQIADTRHKSISNKNEAINYESKSLIACKSNDLNNTNGVDRLEPVDKYNQNSSKSLLMDNDQVNHEHTDSGLGVENDYSYFNERLFENIRLYESNQMESNCSTNTPRYTFSVHNRVLYKPSIPASNKSHSISLEHILTPILRSSQSLKNVKKEPNNR